MSDLTERVRGIKQESSLISIEGAISDIFGSDIPKLLKSSLENCQLAKNRVPYYLNQDYKDIALSHDDQILLEQITYKLGNCYNTRNEAGPVTLLQRLADELGVLQNNKVQDARLAIYKTIIDNSEPEQAVIALETGLDTLKTLVKKEKANPRKWKAYMNLAIEFNDQLNSITDDYVAGRHIKENSKNLNLNGFF
jgi:hypothetical protein